MNENPVLDALRAENASIITKIGDEGMGLDPLAVLKQRLDVVTDFFLNATGSSETALELEWESRMAGLLEDLDAQVTSDTL
jgi:hypothetical protein